MTTSKILSVTTFPKCQLLIADIPYNLGNNAYASNPSWYKDGDNTNGESELAGKDFFDTDKDFRPAEFMHFCTQMMRPEPKQRGAAPAMIVFCEFEQQFVLIELAKRYGLNNYINLVFRKKLLSAGFEGKHENSRELRIRTFAL